jgi:hypothetical protein
MKQSRPAVAGLALGVGLTAVAVWLVPALTSPGAGMRLFSPVVLTLVGGSPGLAQTALLRRHLRMPGLWVVANTLAWLGLGLLIGKSIDRTLDADPSMLRIAEWSRKGC